MNEETVRKALTRLRDFLVDSGHTNSGADLEHGSLGLLSGCIPGEGAAENILRMAYKELHSGRTRFTTGHEEPRDATFSRFFGLKFDRLRR